MEYKALLRSDSLLLALYGVSPLLLNPLFAYLAVSPNGSENFLLPNILFVVVLVWAFIALPVSLLLLVAKKHRKSAINVIAFSAVFIPAEMLGINLGAQVRTSAFQALAKRSEPLVCAIHDYARAKGMPPGQFKDLVPGYLKEIPGTNIAAYPSYELYSDTSAPKNYYGNPWVLMVFTPTLGINFDQFMYFPLQNYPLKGYGGAIEKIGKWAYVHE